MCTSLDSLNEGNPPGRRSQPNEALIRSSSDMLEAITRKLEANGGSFGMGFKADTGEWMARLEWLEEEMVPSFDDEEEDGIVRVPYSAVGVDKVAAAAIEVMLREAGL